MGVPESCLEANTRTDRSVRTRRELAAHTLHASTTHSAVSPSLTTIVCPVLCLLPPGSLHSEKGTGPGTEVPGGLRAQQGQGQGPSQPMTLPKYPTAATSPAQDTAHTSVCDKVLE